MTSRAFMGKSLLAAVVLLSGGAPLMAQEGSCSLPDGLAGKAEILFPGQPGYDQAKIEKAVMPEGKGGVSDARVVRLTRDLPVYRMWNGPDKVNAAGHTNRIGGWWGYQAPAGTQAEYRRNYDICLEWNDLTWMASCTLKAGSVVAVGPGQSVSAETCGDPTGQEHYPQNPGYWQIYVDSAWRRGTELVCPDQSADYAADPNDIAKPIAR